jgi:hypothetical protein
MRVGTSTKKRKYKLQTVFSLGVLAQLLRRAKWIDGSAAKPREIQGRNHISQPIWNIQ